MPFYINLCRDHTGAGTGAQVFKCTIDSTPEHKDLIITTEQTCRDKTMKNSNQPVDYMYCNCTIVLITWLEFGVGAVGSTGGTPENGNEDLDISAATSPKIKSQKPSDTIP